MKKLMMIAAMVLMSTGAFAQEAGMKAVGATFSEYLLSSSRLGLGAKAQYSFTDNIRAEVDFKFYPKSNSNMVNPTISGQYLFPIIDKLYVYPFAGIGLLTAVDTDLNTMSMFCFKTGAGAEYFITDQFKGIFETYYQVAKKDGYSFNRPIISIGAAYIF